MICLVDVAAGEAGLDGYRAHILERNTSLINRLDEQAILVDATTIDLCEMLSHRLDVSDLWKFFPQGRVKTEGCRCLASILLSRGNKDAWGDGVQ